RLHPFPQRILAPLALPQVAGGPEAQDRDGDRGQQPAERLQHDRELVPEVALRIGLPRVRGTGLEAQSHLLSRVHLPASCFRPRSYLVGLSYTVTFVDAEPPL